MSHEFEVHHLVSELVFLLQVQDKSQVQTYSELLLKNRTPYVTTQVSAHASKRKLAEFSSNGESFLAKYEELKMRQTRDLNPLVYLLSRLADDPDLCGFLRETRPPDSGNHVTRELGVEDVAGLGGPDLPAPGKSVVLSEQELVELRGQLASFATTLQEKGKPLAEATPPEYPPLPAWTNDRVFLSQDFVVGGLAEKGLALSSLPVAMQQYLILEDLLNILVGVDGRYIHPETLAPDSSYRTFTVDKALDPSLLALVKRTLPLASHYSIVQRFIAERSKFIHGMVNEGICSAMRGLLKEYLVVVAQLESQQSAHQLTLQKLWYYVQPCMKTLDILSRIAVGVASGKCRGGKTLTMLHNITAGYIGDERSQEICLHITQAACKPYLAMLELWVYQGLVSDPYHEFMITEHQDLQKDRLHDEYNDSYWEKRYTVSQENIPSFLEHLADKILRTGKYLNVVSESGADVKCPGTQVVSYSVQERHYVEMVDRAHNYASQELLQLMIRDHDLLGHLRSIKHCFLLDQGDLLVHFMDMASEELGKPMSDILPQRLESFLELAIRGSLVNSDPYSEKLRPLLVPYDLVTQLLYIIAIQPEHVGDQTKPPLTLEPSVCGLTGLQAFSLDFDVGWPLSLVLSRKCLFKYQMLFRHLFFCKHVERQLCETWTRHKQAKGLPLLAHPWFASAYALLQRMLHFVQNLQYYTTFEVLEPSWVVLEKNLRSAKTIDDVLGYHGDFLDRSLRDCLLSDKEVLKTVSRLMSVCVRFTEYLREADMSQEGHVGRKSLTQRAHRLKVEGSARLPSGELMVGGADPQMLRSRLLSVEYDELSGSFEENIAKLDGMFTKDLVGLLDSLYDLGGQTMGGMVSRLDFNGFYQGHMTSRTSSLNS